MNSCFQNVMSGRGELGTRLMGMLNKACPEKASADHERTRRHVRRGGKSFKSYKSYTGRGGTSVKSFKSFKVGHGGGRSYKSVRIIH